MGLNKRLIDQAGGAAGGAATDNFAPVLYTGTGSTQSITSLDFQPDLVWIKSRDSIYSGNHFWFDGVRGAGKVIYSDATDAEVTNPIDGYVGSFDSNGFSLSSGTRNTNDVSNSGENYVAWCWKAGGAAVSNTDGSITSTVSANPDAGFSIVKYTGTLSSPGNISVGHGLSNPPELIISKRIDSTGSWRIRPFFLNNNPYDYLEFDTDALAQLNSSDGTMSLPTSTTFDNNWNTALGGVGEVIAYCFHSVDGYQKVGSYTGTGTAGNSVTTGFQPRFILIKRTDTSGSGWGIFDSVRGGNLMLRANVSDAEADGNNSVSFESNGFTLPETGVTTNTSGGTYIYLAIA